MMQFLESEIQQYNKMVWATLLGFEIQPEPGTFDYSSKDMVTGSVQVTGKWNGVITLYLPSTLVNHITETMFSLESGEASPETKKDAIGELINMVGGNIKSMLPQPSTLSIPIFSMEGQSQQFPFTKKVTQCKFTCNGSSFALSLYEQEPAEKKTVSA
ncbi:MAG: chemotaxis protein CheX [Nitrospinales bacterium]|jgi:chemotaxis protein CheX